MTTFTHDELRDLVPIYALDALDGTEEFEVRTHLQACPACQESLDDYLLATGNLALEAEPLPPPAALKARLLTAVAATPRNQAAPVLRSAKAARRWGWERVTAIVAVAALFVVGAFSLALVGRLRSQDSQQRQFVQALGGSAANAIGLKPVGGPANITAQVLVSASGTSGGLVITGLADPGSKVYKVWAIVNSQAVALSTFRPDSSGTALVPLSGGALAAMQGMAVTLESNPNVSMPRGPRVLQTA